MAGHGLGRADGNFGLLAENLLDRFCLADVAETGGSCVSVDVIDIVRRNLRVIERASHGARGTSAILRRRSDVIGVRRKSVAGALTIDLRSTLLRGFKLF